MCNNDFEWWAQHWSQQRGEAPPTCTNIWNSMELFCGRELITGTGSSIPLCTIWQSPWKMLKWTRWRPHTHRKNAINVISCQCSNQAKLQVHLKRDAYLFHRCSLSAPLCHNDHIYSSCLLKQESDKFQKLKTNCGKTVINTIQKYKDDRRDRVVCFHWVDLNENTASHTDVIQTIRQDFISLWQLLELLLSLLFVLWVFIWVPPQGQLSVPAHQK